MNQALDAAFEDTMNSKISIHHQQAKENVAFQKKYQSDNGTKGALSWLFEVSVQGFPQFNVGSFQRNHEP